MIAELRGGPKDGQLVDVDADLIFGEGEVYFPHDERRINPVSTYRWLFGEPDHLDFAGYQK